MMAEEITQLQIRFITKQKKYAVPDTTFALSSSVTTSELNELVNQLLNEGVDNAETIHFDFLAGGEFIRTSLGEHIAARSNLSTEGVVDVEYVECLPPPEAQDFIVLDDWISSVQVKDSWIVCGCYDDTVQIWSTSGIHKLTATGHAAPVKCVRWVDSEGDLSYFLSGSMDETIMLWEWNKTDGTVKCCKVFKGHTKSVESIGLSDDSKRFASGSFDNILKIWSLVDEHDDEPDSKVTKSSSKKQTKAPQVSLKGHKGAISGVSWKDKVEVVTCSWDHTLKIWDTEMSSSIATLAGNKAFFDVSFSPRSQMLVTASSDRHVRLYDPRSNEGQLCKLTMTSHTGWVTSVMWSKTRDNLLVSGSHDKTAKLWDVRSPKVSLYDMAGHEAAVFAVDWSNPSVIATGADCSVRVFNAKTD